MADGLMAFSTTQSRFVPSGIFGQQLDTETSFSKRPKVRLPVAVPGRCL